MAGRDDDYTPDFKYRMRTTLEFLAASVELSGHAGKVEAVIADWGGETPLSEGLRLNPAACALARFVRIPRDTILQLQGGTDRFNTSLATNAATRRADGAYKAICGADILIPAHSVDILVRTLEQGRPVYGLRPDNALILCGRKQIPWEAVRDQPSAAEWARFLDANAWMLEKERCQAPEFLYGGASFMMMRARLWDEFRGVCENMGNWGWSDIELTLRVANRYPWIEVSGLGVEVFDLGHQPSGDRRSVSIKTPNKWLISPPGHVNAPDWGLAGHDFDIVRAIPAPPPSPRRESAPKEGAWRHVRKTFTAMLDAGAWFGEPFLDESELGVALLLTAAAELSEPSLLVDFGATPGCPAAAVLSMRPWLEYLAVDAWSGFCGSPGR
jgi:hypothetical protein